MIMISSKPALDPKPAVMGIETRGGVGANIEQACKCATTLEIFYRKRASLCPDPTPTPRYAPHTVGTVAGDF